MQKKLDFNSYQKGCAKTAVYPKVGKSFVYPALGLADEAGEVLGKIKRVFRDDGGKLTKERKAEICHELGDVLWYIAQLSTELDLKLLDVARENLNKLSSRFSRNEIHGSGDNR